MKKKLLAIVLCAALIISSTQAVYADRKSELKNSVAAEENKLKETQSQIESNSQANDAIKANITELDSQLISLMTNIEVIKSDIESTETKIEETKVKLEEAEEDRDKQYEDMGQRIRFLYEKNKFLGWISYIIEAENFSQLLNRIVYANDMYRYDRDQLEKYEECIANIEAIQDELEASQASLNNEKTSLEEQQVSLDKALAEKKAQSANYELEIENLQKEAAKLSEEIASKNAEIADIQRREEEAARRAAEEAARRAAEEEARRAAEEAEKEESERESSTEANSGNNNESSGNSSNPASGNEQPSKPKPAEPTPTPEPPASSGGVSGQDIADFACQFIGNPYVSGGCSLTNGADCAGFVYSVYKHFGFIMQRNPDWQSTLYGRQISISELKPGDIVGYYGHVGIYVGNNTIVHASCPEVGITLTSPITYRSIRACARIFDY